jgi:pyruvate dehydrogenase E2 component (dihydrolipoamide acetyltransferase)
VPAATATAAPKSATPAPAAKPAAGGFTPVSPRARGLAEKLGVDASAIPGSGPGGRVLSTDIRNAVDNGSAVKATPLAKEIMAETGKRPVAATGIGGLARAMDLGKPAAQDETPKIVPYQGIRKLIGERMLQSLQNAAQLTLNASADATGLMALRKMYKDNAADAGLPNITMNDLVCWVVARTLPQFPEINALLDKEKATLTRHTAVNLAFAVDTPRGLMVPVVANAHRLSLSGLAAAMAGLAEECRKGSINPDFLSGGTFTVSNLGGMGIESFTPVLNPPQVGILGVCAITQKPVPAANGGVVFRPSMGLSLTFDHQAVDGAPAAKFLQAVAKGIEGINTALALRGAM